MYRMYRTVLVSLVLVLFLVSGALAQVQPIFKGSEPIPNDATVLFNGKDLSQWVKRGSDNEPATWKVEKGYMLAGGGDIWTKQKFADCQLHVEFWVPLMPDRTGQGRGNSGIFLQGWNYEVQILDSYKLPTTPNDCGAIYNVYAPSVNACRPPQTWQTYDIVYHAPKFDADGKKTADARMTVMLNGVFIHENADVARCTPSADMEEPKEPMPIVLQDHGCPVRFRNVWVRPLAQ